MSDYPEVGKHSSPVADTDSNLNVWLVIGLSLLLCCGLPLLPIYLWRKGKLSRTAAIGIAVGWVALYVALAAYGNANPPAELEEKSTPTATASPEAAKKPDPKPTESRKPAGPTAAEKRTALVARAEKNAKRELGDNINDPYWEGVTFKGHYVSSKKVCVDRTLPAGSGLDGTGGNAGYVVVYFPTGKVGAPQDGTCGKPAPKPVDWEPKVRAALKDALNDKDKGPTSVVYNGDIGIPNPVVSWRVSSNLTNNMTKKGAQIDLTDMLEALQKLQKKGMKIDHATFEGKAELVDEMGNESWDRVVLATYSGDTIKRINFENFLFKNVYNIANDVTLHPAFQ